MAHSDEYRWRETLRTVEVVSPFVVRVVEERTDAAVLQDVRGIQASLHPSILRDNGLQVDVGRMVLPGAIYRHYFGRRVWEIRTQGEARDLRLLTRHFRDILQAGRRIREDPDLAVVYSTAWFVGGIPVAINTFLTLGTLIEHWASGDLVQPCPRCGGSAYAYHLIGSFMSGRTSAQGICPACASRVTFHPWRGLSLARATGKLRRDSQILQVGQRRSMRLVYPAALPVPAGPFPTMEDFMAAL